MPNNPVQVILDSRNYINRVDNAGGGGHKDFFAGRDDLFKAHKKSLLGSLQEARAVFSKHKGPPIAFAHVALQGEALAKSRRPTAKLFPPERVPIIGGSTLGD